MNDSMTICRIEDSPFSYDDVVNLIHESFEERLNQGLVFTCSSVTVSQFKERMRSGIVLVAFDSNTGLLKGTASTHLRSDKSGHLYGYNEYLAVLPSAKREGVGTRLLKERIQLLKTMGAEYVLSDTACGARSSVKWHLKNGFKIVALRSFQNTNYYSFEFRKSLLYPTKWDNSFYRFFRFCFSCCKTILVRKKNGSYTMFGRLISHMLES